uniref:Cytoplasmic dynein 1 light intermediate chain 1 n=1 Tax=Sphaerodactylus townsendi TaxID=933632 RepID=A0ACB8FUH0_9SAUR
MAAVVGGRAGSFSSTGLGSGYGGAAFNATNSGSGPDPREDDDGQNLWSCILSEVSTRSRSKLPSGKNVLLLVCLVNSWCGLNLPWSSV